METKSLKERLEEAQEAVANLEEPFKTMAFEKILNSVVISGNIQKENAENSQKQKREIKKSLVGSKKRIDEETEEMIKKINRTEHSIIKKINKAIDLSMYVLKIMEEKGSDSLTPSQISDILLEVFRKKITKQAVGMALLKADEFVHREKIIHRGAISYKYKLVEKGEDYINLLIENLEQETHNQTSLKAETLNTETEGSNISG
jgi:hypothetical protein